MMGLGVYSIVTKTWHFRSGNLATHSEALFFGIFSFVVGFILFLLQIRNCKNKKQ